MAMHGQNLLRTLLFVIAFSLGAAALSGSILSNELLGYLHNRRLESAAAAKTARLQQLSADYDVLLEQVRQDPNVAKRIASATLGIEPNEPNVAYPKLTAGKLAAAKQAFSQLDDTKSQPDIPRWLKRVNEPRKRLALFLSGAGLVVISLVCFAPLKIQKKVGRG